MKPQRTLSPEEKEALDNVFNIGMERGQLMMCLKVGRKSKATKNKVYLTKKERRELMLCYKTACDVCNTGNVFVTNDKCVPTGRKPFTKPLRFIDGPMHTKKLPDGSSLTAHELCIR